MVRPLEPTVTTNSLLISHRFPTQVALRDWSRTHNLSPVVISGLNLCFSTAFLGSKERYVLQVDSPMSVQKSSTVALFGLPISNVTMAEAVARLEENIDSGETHQIATANLDFARNSLRDASLHKVICDCSMVLPDGAPILWASHLFGKPLKERVTGVDLIPHLAQLSVRRGFGIFLLGSTDENAGAAQKALELKYPGVNFVGRYSPPVASLDDMNDSEILRRIEMARPDILLVAFGNPKQEMWIHRNRGRLTVPVAIGIGGALDMIAGSLKRAPRWVQVLQMEWLFRMAQEPSRLVPRYARDAAALARHLPMGLAVSQMQGHSRVEGKLAIRTQGNVRILATPATLSGDLCSALTTEARLAVEGRQMVVVDLSATTRIEADGLGCLLEVRRVLLSAGLRIWLAGLSNPVRRVLQFTAVLDLFLLALNPADAIRFATVGRGEGEWSAPVVPFVPRQTATENLSKVAEA